MYSHLHSPQNNRCLATTRVGETFVLYQLSYGSPDLEPAGLEPATTSLRGCSSTCIRCATSNTARQGIGKTTATAGFPARGFEPHGIQCSSACIRAKPLILRLLSSGDQGDGETWSVDNDVIPPSIRYSTAVNERIGRRRMRPDSQELPAGIPAVDLQVHVANMVLYSCVHSHATPSSPPYSFTGLAATPCRSRSPSAPHRSCLR